MTISALAQEQTAVFISYHHRHDQRYYDHFKRLFVSAFGLVVDHSLQAPINSDNPRYILRRIRERCIAHASCTLVLCGDATGKRKFIDWEIKSSLDKCNGLIGVALPCERAHPCAQADIPARLADNIASGFALWMTWQQLLADPLRLPLLVREAQSRPKHMIRNQRPMLKRNGDEQGCLNSERAYGT